MALNTQMSNFAVDRQAQDIIDDLADGYLRLYSGPQPVNADTPITGQVLLAELRFLNPAAPAPSNGVINFSAMASVSGLANGQANFFRCLKLDGTTVIFDGSIGRSNANMILNAVLIVSGAVVTINTFSHTVAKAASGY